MVCLLEVFDPFSLVLVLTNYSAETNPSPARTFLIATGRSVTILIFYTYAWPPAARQELT